jgi:serine kinase of HPr protein (carbohydrate metabolism regulator)
MKVENIVDVLKARVICGSDKLETEIRFAFASDLMSDVLTIDVEHLLLITGMANLQVLRTAEMADIFCIVFVRDKKVTPEMRQIAEENQIVLLESPYSMFRAVSVLHDCGMLPVY